MVGVGAAARQRVLEPAARRLFPVAEALPEEPVEPPDDAVAERSPVVEEDAPVVGRFGADRRKRRTDVVTNRMGRGLAKVDGELREREELTVALGGAPHGHGIAEVRPVLDPVEMDAQARERARIEPALLDRVEHTGQSLAARRRAPALELVHVDDHRRWLDYTGRRSLVLAHTMNRWIIGACVPPCSMVPGTSD